MIATLAKTHSSTIRNSSRPMRPAHVLRDGIVFLPASLDPPAAAPCRPQAF
jgi:hypothetical protein